MTTPNESQRVSVYPIVIQHPLRLFLTTTESMVSRARQVAKKIEEDVYNQLGLDADAAIFEMTPANEVSPQSGNQETYDYVVVGVMVANANAEDLKKYTDKLAEFYSKRENMPFDNPEKNDWLPLPDVFLPDTAWVKDMQAKLNRRAANTAGMTNSDGSLNSEFMAEADKKYREANPESTTTSLGSVTSPGGGNSAVQDILDSGEDPASFF